jgi:hypothetical protein
VLRPHGFERLQQVGHAAAAGRRGSRPLGMSLLGRGPPLLMLLVLVLLVLLLLLLWG